MGIPRTAQSSSGRGSPSTLSGSSFTSCLATARDLNPVELLNHDVKANAVGRKRPRNLAEMIDSVTDYLQRRREQPNIIKRFFTHPATAYGA